MTARKLAMSTQRLEELVDIEIRPHGSNLLTKAKSSPSAQQASALEKIIPRYLSLAKKGKLPITDFDHWLILYTKGLDTYLSYLRSGPGNLFSHQSDFQVIEAIWTSLLVGYSGWK